MQIIFFLLLPSCRDSLNTDDDDFVVFINENSSSLLKNAGDCMHGIVNYC